MMLYYDSVNIHEYIYICLDVKISLPSTGYRKIGQGYRQRTFDHASIQTGLNTSVRPGARN